MPPQSPIELSFFAKFFLEKKQDKGGGRVRPKYCGEALTEDEAFDRLREHKAQREAKETKKKKQQKGNNTSRQQAKSKDAQIEENICQGCGDCYDDDDDDDDDDDTDTQEFWVGCDR